MKPVDHEAGSADAFARLARALAEVDGIMPTLQEVVSYAVEAVPCDWAAAVATDSIGSRPARLNASSDPDVLATVAEIAGAAGTSPGRTAFMESATVHCPDLTTEDRFGAYPSEMVARTPIRSVLSLSLGLNDQPLGVMTLYAAEPHAFGPARIERAALLADHAAIAVANATASERADHLELALVNSRVIGMATGVLVERDRLTPEQAFDVLRRVSQLTNRKLAAVALELVETGALPGVSDM